MSMAVVLVHGVAGWDRVWAAKRPARDFFPGVRACLEQQGYEVFQPRVSPMGSVVCRARELAVAIRERFQSRPIHLVAHSLGGLDARYLVGCLGFESQVRSLTTIGTPHRGTTLADWAVRRGEWAYRWWLQTLGLGGAAFRDLTTEACARFNERVPRVPGLPVLSVAGVCQRPWLNPWWGAVSSWLANHEGPNDGVVSEQSARWGSYHETWTADHLNLVNWPNRRMQKAGSWSDRGPDYARLLRQVVRSR